MRSDRVAYLAPFLVFLAFLFLEGAVKKIGEGYAHWAFSEPRYWIIPLQTLVCSILLWKLRKRIEFRPFSGFAFATLIGLLALVVWISPQEGWRLIDFGQRILGLKIWEFPQAVFGFPPRTDGFLPHFFGAAGWPYWLNLTVRIFRMTVVVAFVEELFWRGFLLRFLVREDFAAVPFGTFTWRSFLISSVAFCLEHQPSDWPAAVLTGALFNLVAYRTRSLAACILTHAVTNLALAFYILRTGQWGFW